MDVLPHPISFVFIALTVFATMVATLRGWGSMPLALLLGYLYIALLLTPASRAGPTLEVAVLWTIVKWTLLGVLGAMAVVGKQPKARAPRGVSDSQPHAPHR